MLPLTLAFATWIRPQGTGSRTLYSKHTGCDRVLTIAVNNDNQVRATVGYISFEDTVTLGTDQWSFLGVTFDYDATTDKTTAKIHYNGVLGSYMPTESYRVLDNNKNAKQYIGVDSGLSDFFVGFMWRLSIYNYLYSSFNRDIQSNGYPSGLAFGLSLLPLWQNLKGQNCDLACVNGCIRPSDCHLCLDPLCESCPSIDTLECNQCLPNASLQAQCQCNEGFRWDSATGVCESCDSTCLACSDTSKCTSCLENAQLQGDLCVCSPGYYGVASNCSACALGCSQCQSFL